MSLTYLHLEPQMTYIFVCALNDLNPSPTVWYPVPENVPPITQSYLTDTLIPFPCTSPILSCSPKLIHVLIKALYSTSISTLPLFLHVLLSSQTNAKCMCCPHYLQLHVTTPLQTQTFLDKKG